LTECDSNNLITIFTHTMHFISWFQCGNRRTFLHRVVTRMDLFQKKVTWRNNILSNLRMKSVLPELLTLNMNIIAGNSKYNDHTVVDYRLLYFYYRSLTLKLYTRGC